MTLSLPANPEKNLRMAAGRSELRKSLWPEIPESQLWNRKKETGFATVPRPLPLIMVILDSLTKGTPVSTTYLDLWCRMFDEGYVKLDKPHEMALASGFTTGRGPQIWASRLDLLQTLGFIQLAPGAQGPRSFALIFNPYFILRKKKEAIDDRLYNAVMAQALSLGAQTLPASVSPPPPPS